MLLLINAVGLFRPSQCIYYFYLADFTHLFLSAKQREGVCFKPNRYLSQMHDLMDSLLLFADCVSKADSPPRKTNIKISNTMSKCAILCFWKQFLLSTLWFHLWCMEIEIHLFWNLKLVQQIWKLTNPLKIVSFLFIRSISILIRLELAFINCIWLHHVALSKEKTCKINYNDLVNYVL